MSYSDDTEYQHKVSQYVSDHVYYCLSELVSEVAPKVMEGAFEHYNEEDAIELFQTQPDQDDCIHAGFSFFEQNDKWYYTEDDPEPEEIAEYTLEELVEFAESEVGICYDEDEDKPEDFIKDAIECLKAEGFSIDPNHYGQKEPKTYTLWQLYDVSCLEEFDDEDEAVEGCIRDNDIQGCEVYEHWLVSDHLGYKLKQHGQTVVDDFFGLRVWCRTCTGQAISLDAVVTAIYDEVHGEDDG